MRHSLPLQLLAASALALAGCATMPILNEVNEVAADLALPVSEEQKLGVETAKEVESKSKLSTDAELVRYVGQVGQRVARASPNPDKWTFTFKVVDDPKTVNAFAIPGGNVYVYSGLLKAAKDEAQLASVLAHEVAHVTSRHIAKRMVAAYGLETLSNVALGKDAGTLAQIGSAIVTQGLLLKNSRDDETEADAKGVVATAKAGYDPRAMVEFFQILKQGEGTVPEFVGFLSDHPLTADRIRALMSDIQRKKLTGANRNLPAYQAMQARVHEGPGAMADPAGDLNLGKYRLLERLGRGGMAEVFLAEAVGVAGFQKTVAVKRILPHLADDAEFLEMFLNEARLSSRLTHPNIVQIFDLGEADGSHFIAMEYVDGPCLRTLGQRCAERQVPVPPGHAARIVADACEGLAFAHELQQDGRPLHLVHRDVSPDNVLLMKSGAVKVADFGIAKAMAHQRRTKAGIIRGKVWYMPPEQLLDEPLDCRVDVFALGVVLYELLTGMSPFEGSNETRAIKAILDDPPTPLLERRPDCPAELWEIIATALEKDREARFASCRAFKRALEQFLVSRREIVGSHEVAQLLCTLFPERYGEATAAVPVHTPAARTTLPQRQASAVPCPGCGTAMALGHAGGVVVDGCHACGGLWLDEGEMQLLANRPAGLASLSRLYKPEGEWDLAGRKRVCPRCQVVLEPYEFNSLRGIWLDRCGTCRGLYLDHGEAEAIEARLRQP